MFVIKRNGQHEAIQFDKITARLNAFVADLPNVETVLVTQRVARGVSSTMHTSEIDTLAAEESASMTTIHPEYDILASRIIISNLQRTAPNTFVESMRMVHQNSLTPNHEIRFQDFVGGRLNSRLCQFLDYFGDRLNERINHSADFNYSSYAGASLVRSQYVHTVGGIPVETPQYMLLRVALGVTSGSVDDSAVTLAEDGYDLMSEHAYTHATPTLYNAGMVSGQMSSCYLLTMKEDSIDGIYSTLRQCALISRDAGGIGLSVSRIRASGSIINSTGQQADGLVPMLRVFNTTARYVDQGGRRKGAFAVYLEPWHPDVIDFLSLRKNTGVEDRRTRDLFTALWVPDLFMNRVERGEMWSFMCPATSPGLNLCYGGEFEALYTRYEKEGRAIRAMPARDLWKAILDAQTETGTPYLLYKDACNRKSNQKNIGCIECSNLCVEIVQYTSPNEVAVCNLASLSLPHFVANGYYDFKKLYNVVKHVVTRLDGVIDLNTYPVPEARVSNMKHRPIGIGVQGFQETLFKLNYAFASPEARKLNSDIFAVIYYAAIESSVHMSRTHGTYASFPGSPASKGILQPDLWGVTPIESVSVDGVNMPLDWNRLRRDVVEYGLRHSLMVAVMPTASTSTLFGNTEGCEPQSYNAYVRNTNTNSFIIVNKCLIQALQKRGIQLTRPLMEKILVRDGSVQDIAEIPSDIQEVYRTVWEIPLRTQIDMCADRAPYICQSQSFNIHLKDPTPKVLSAVHMYAWKKGLKTGMYYLRREAKVDAIKFSVEAAPVCTRESGCTSCGS